MRVSSEIDSVDASDSMPDRSDLLASPLDDHAEALESAIRWLIDHRAAVNFDGAYRVAIVFQSNFASVGYAEAETLLDAVEAGREYENRRSSRSGKNNGGSGITI